MSAKDWLLQKLIRAEIRHAELKGHLNERNEVIDELENEAARLRAQVQEKWDKEAELVALREKVSHIEGGKRFRVVVREGDARAEAAVLAIQHAGGDTLITISNEFRFE